MMRTLALIMLSVSSVLLTSSTVQGDTYVYICTGPDAYSYHKSQTCRGLNKCSAEIESVTLTYAKAKKRTSCKICYKK